MEMDGGTRSKPFQGPYCVNFPLSRLLEINCVKWGTCIIWKSQMSWMTWPLLFSAHQSFFSPNKPFLSWRCHLLKISTWRLLLRVVFHKCRAQQLIKIWWKSLRGQVQYPRHELYFFFSFFIKVKCVTAYKWIWSPVMLQICSVLQVIFCTLKWKKKKKIELKMQNLFFFCLAALNLSVLHQHQFVFIHDSIFKWRKISISHLIQFL